MALFILANSVLGAEKFTFADALINLPTQKTDSNSNVNTGKSAPSVEPKSNPNYGPQLYISTASPFLTSERSSVSSPPNHIPNYARYIPISPKSSYSLKNALLNNMSYSIHESILDSRVIDSNDVYFDPPAFEEEDIPDATQLIESIIKSYLADNTLTPNERTTTTEAPSLEFLSFSFEDEYDDVVRSKVKREDARPSEVR